MPVKTLEDLEVGHIYKITVTECREEGSKGWRKQKEYRLLKKYKHFMLFENEYGTKESFTNNELYQKIMEGAIVS